MRLIVLGMLATGLWAQTPAPGPQGGGSGAPTGPCGGDLGGTEPNCTLNSPITNTFIGNATGGTAQLRQNVPSNGSRYLFISQNANAAKGPFDIVVDTNLFVATQDEAMAIGYNVAPGGGRVLSSEPSFRWKTEQDYDNSTTHLVESYFEWASADGMQQKRPLFWQFDRTTGNIAGYTISSSGVTFTDWTSGATTATLSNISSLTLFGSATQSGDTELNVQGQNGKAGILELGGATGGLSISRRDTTPTWLISPKAGVDGIILNGGTSQIGYLSNGDFRGAHTFENPSPTTLNTVTLKEGSSQSTAIFNILNSGNTLFKVWWDHTGSLYFANDVFIGFSSTTEASNAKDLTLCRQAAGVLELGASTGCAASGTIRSHHQASDGTAGITGTTCVAASMQVKDGLVVAGCS